MEPESDIETQDSGLAIVATRDLPRWKAALFSLVLAVGIGFGYHLLGLDFSPSPALLAQLAGAVVAVTVLHEGLHGAAGAILGHRPVFGVKPPLVYTTFGSIMPRSHLAIVALVPLISLDAAAVALYAADAAPLFCALCFGINTLGAAGDVWVAAVLIAAPRGSMVKDTKSGVEIYAVREGR